MNQTPNGGQWNLLGTFTLNPALNPMVKLSDQANGRVVASGVSTDHVTYTPTLPSAGMVDIYAKWTESATRAQAVTYTVQHAGGATDILVNQQQPSAGCFRLGRFTMPPRAELFERGREFFEKDYCEHGRSIEVYAKMSRPLGSRIARPNSFAVSSHSWITTSTLARACW